MHQTHMTATGDSKNANATELAMKTTLKEHTKNIWLRFVHCSPIVQEKQTNQSTFLVVEKLLYYLSGKHFQQCTREIFNICTVVLSSNKNTHFLTKKMYFHTKL